MHKVGIIGLGMMGATHLDVYSKRTDVRVVAVADVDPDRRSGKSIAAGNIKGQAQGGFDFSTARQYAEGMDLIRDREVEIVDVCLATPLHRRYAEAALAAGKHTLVEKPLARTAADAAAIASAAANAHSIAMPAMCMRFWPGWTWLKEAVASRRYGRVLSADFRRIASHPGGKFYCDGDACGGGILDLHIHDTDFVQYLFGIPRAVESRGYARVSGAIDHVATTYLYDRGADAPLVTAEGSWTMQAGFPFTMQYTVNFEQATAVFDLAATPPLNIYQQGKPAEPIELPAGMGYEHEIAYFLDCVAAGRQPTTVTLAQAADAVRIVEAECESVRTGRAVSIK
jgi:predicted dehydrogenase